MNKKLLTRTFWISSIGGVSFFAGSYFESKKQSDTQPNSNNIILCNNKLKSLPALPIFGTVSAATAVSLPPPSSSGLIPKGSIDSAASTLTTTTSGSNRVSQIMKYGFPGLDNIRSYSNYVLSYDRRNRIAHWVFEHLTASDVKHNDAVDRAKCDFKPDESIHPYFRSLNTDYKQSGYDRGHLAAAGNHKSTQLQCEQTFYLTNMAPQVGVGFNRDIWNTLEKYVRKLTKTYVNVYVCTGPLYLPYKESDGKMYVKYRVIGANNVAVPTHFYKVIVCETANHELDMEAYVLPNKSIDNKTPITVFQVPPESVERAAGLLFFDRISRKQLRKINGKSI